MDNIPKKTDSEVLPSINDNPYASPPSSNPPSDESNSLTKKAPFPHPLAVLSILLGCSILGPLEISIYLQFFLPNGTTFRGEYPDATFLGLIASVPFALFTIIMYFVGVHAGRNYS